jgi:hypothetical protein
LRVGSGNHDFEVVAWGAWAGLRFLAFAWLAVAGASDGFGATRPPVLVDLADLARAQPPEFAADALLRIADAPKLTDVAWKREILEDAFHLAAGAQQPFARRNWTGRPGSLFDKAYAQGLDACTLQSKAVEAMLAIDFKKARELFGEIPAPRIPRLTCDDAMVYDVSIFYATVGEVAARAFSAKEAAREEPFHLLRRYAADVTSPAQAAPIARMLVGASLKPAQFEMLVDSFAGGLAQLSGDDRSFSAAMGGDADAAIASLSAECAHRRINAQPLVEAWRMYLSRQLSGARCTDPAARGPQPAGQCESPQCQQLAAQFKGLIIGPNGFGLTPEQKAASEWGGGLRQYMAALADWTQDDDPAAYFQSKSHLYGVLFEVAPNGAERDLLLSTLLAWLQQNGYQRDHRAEWFYPVNRLIILAFADPVGMRATIQELRRSSDPVIALYAQLEQLLPRPMDVMIGLL